MKRYVLLLVLFLLGGLAWAQKKPVLGTPVARQLGTDIYIDYSIQMEYAVVCHVAIYLSCDGGRHFQKTPLREVTGDVGNITESGNKTIVWHVLKEESVLTGEDLVFKLNVERFWKRTDLEEPEPVPQPVVKKEPKPKKEKAPVKPAILVAPTVGVMPGISFGLIAGWAGPKVGVYGKFRSNFVSAGTSYNCTSDGKADGGYIWTTGKSKVSNMSITAGVMLPVGGVVYPYAGVGFAKRDLAWEDTQGDWARVTDASASGIGMEAGVLLRFGLFGLHAGVNTGGFKYIGVDAGIALFF